MWLAKSVKLSEGGAATVFMSKAKIRFCQKQLQRTLRFPPRQFFHARGARVNHFFQKAACSAKPFVERRRGAVFFENPRLTFVKLLNSPPRLTVGPL
jgi:hypothetical protein